MKKTIVCVALALAVIALMGQEQEQPPVQPDETPQVQLEAPQAVPQALPEGRYVDTFRLAHAFIHAGKEYPAGTYWLSLGEKDGQEVFFLANARKELLFEELAIVKAHPAEGNESHFHVNISGTSGNEFIRIFVTTQREWQLGYLLVKK